MKNHHSSSEIRNLLVLVIWKTVCYTYCPNSLKYKKGRGGGGHLILAIVRVITNSEWLGAVFHTFSTCIFWPHAPREYEVAFYQQTPKPQTHHTTSS